MMEGNRVDRLWYWFGSQKDWGLLLNFATDSYITHGQVTWPVSLIYTVAMRMLTSLRGVLCDLTNN